MTRGEGMKILKLEAWNFSSPPRKRFNFLGHPPPVSFEVYKFFQSPPFRVSKNFRSTPRQYLHPPFPCHIKWTFPKKLIFEREHLVNKRSKTTQLNICIVLQRNNRILFRLKEAQFLNSSVTKSFKVIPQHCIAHPYCA